MNTREYATFEDVQRLKGHIENSLKINNECQRAILAEEKQHLDDLIDNLQDRMEEDFKLTGDQIHEIKLKTYTMKREI
jgi:hypothetical protein